jgi:two-component system LytT family sensor kinase
VKNRWVLSTAAILLWSTLGALFALPGLSPGNWRRVLLSSLVQWWSWGLVTPLIFWIDARLPFKKNQLLRRVLAHLPVSLIITMLYSCVVICTAALLSLQAWSVEFTDLVS